jgi:hypothetical protein
MVLGLAPPFLFWKWHKPAPLAFHLSFLGGLTVGVWALVGHWPAALTIGSGHYAALLGQNLYGLALCAGAYAAGVLIESLRARAPITAAYFQEAA